LVFESIKDTLTAIEEDRPYEIGDTKKWRAKYGEKNENGM